MELAKLGFAQARRTAFDDAGDNAADGVADGLHLPYELLHLRGRLAVGAAHGIGLGGGNVVTAVVGVCADVAHLRRIGSNAHSHLPQRQLG